jgi:hypothetical protein
MAIWTAVGQRYTADGWTEEQALFCFESSPEDVAVAAEVFRIRGTWNLGGSLARHGCEDVTRVEPGFGGVPRRGSLPSQPPRTSLPHSRFCKCAACMGSAQVEIQD